MKNCIGYRCTQFAEIVGSSILAKMVSGITATNFLDCPVNFYIYSSVGKHGTEVGREVKKKLKEADVAIPITSYSFSYISTKENATKSGIRIAIMLKFLLEMFNPGGVWPLTIQKSMRNA